MYKNQKGFSAIEGLIVVLVIAIAGSVGLYSWRSSSIITQTVKPLARPLTDCVPQGIDLTSAYSYRGTEVDMTMSQKLISIGAHCNNDNALVDSSNRRIDIEDSFGCWGIPPGNYQELQKQEDQKIQNLKKTYTVLVPQCNPGVA